jgi:hypothetical protein
MRPVEGPYAPSRGAISAQSRDHICPVEGHMCPVEGRFLPTRGRGSAFGRLLSGWRSRIGHPDEVRAAQHLDVRAGVRLGAAGCGVIR